MTDTAKRLPDTNAILRYLLADEPHFYEKANRLFEKVRAGQEKVVILESVLVECVYVLTKFYRVPKKEVSDKMREFLHYKGIINDDKEGLIEALSLYSHHPSLDIVDCILCAKAKMYKMPLFTFDANLKKVYENR